MAYSLGYKRKKLGIALLYIYIITSNVVTHFSVSLIPRASSACISVSVKGRNLQNVITAEKLVVGGP